MRVLPLLAACCLALPGCGGLYYQTRYIPESTEDAFDRRVAGVDDDIYQLPAAPPAIDEHRPRTCERPGVKLKPAPIVGSHEDPQAVDAIASVETGGYDRRPQEIAPLPPMSARLTWGWHDPNRRGAKELIGVPVKGDSDTRPVSRMEGGLGRTPAVVGGYRRDELIWCNPEARER